MKLFSLSRPLNIALMLLLAKTTAMAQYKEFSLSPKGDTLNAIDKKGWKQGKWINTVGEIRSEPGYEEEGLYKNDKKTGPWKKYSSNGDILAIENYKFGGKDGVQEYFSFVGNLERHEEWKGYNPDAPYDTIPIYGEGNNEVINFKIVKAEQYSVPNGEWKFFNDDGRLIRMDRYDRGQLLKDEPAKKTTAAAEPAKAKEKAKPAEILEYEKKYSKKKREHMERQGKTSL